MDEPETIKRQIEETREGMGVPVEALAYKTGVPARAKEAVSDRVEAIKAVACDPAGDARNALRCNHQSLRNSNERRRHPRARLLLRRQRCCPSPAINCRRSCRQRHHR
jgi:hypothetical protein